VLLYTETANFPCHTVTGSLLCTNYRCCFVPDPASAEKVGWEAGANIGVVLGGLGGQGLVSPCAPAGMPRLANTDEGHFLLSPAL